MKRITKITKLFVLAFVMTTLFATVFCVNAKAANNLKPVTNLKQDASRSDVDYVHIGWSKVLGETGQDIWYLVEISENGRDGWQNVKDTSDCSCEISDLLPGKSYFVRVTPYDYDTNVKGGSSTIKVCTGPSVDMWSAKQINATSNSVTFSWTKVEGATSYMICTRDNKIITSTTALQYTISNLQQDADYRYNIFAVRSEGTVSVLGSDIDVSCETVKSGTCYDIKLNQWNWGSNTLVVYAKTKPGFDDYYENVSGFEYSLYDSKDKLVKQSCSEGLCRLKNKAVTNSICYVIARPYYIINNTKCFGTASYKQVFVSQPKVARKKMGRNYKLTWKKVEGAKSYTIYKVNEKSLKKIKTVKKLTYTLKKPKKGKYIIKAENVKLGKKKYTTTLGENYKFITID